ncbi:MAG: hypothetical protein IH620_04970 [Ignavibacterium sp.]|nr:hypothetical protein [Ignavibacterium sp.]
MKKNIYLLFSLLILPFLSLFLFNTCNTTEPTDELTPGRRDYTWTVDTLKPAEGRSLPSRMWGANANDVWAVGLAYLNSYCIWHFDGNSWTNYTPDKYIDPRGIWGTASNNIWIGSTDGAFWKYDGVKWSKFSEIIIPNYQQFIVQSLCGRSANDIYAVGYADSIGGNTYKAIIAHFNGKKWDLINIPTIKNSFKQIFFDSVTSNFIISSWKFNQPDEYIFSFDGNNLKQIYSSTEGIEPSNIGKDVIAILGGSKIYKVKPNAIEMLKDFSSTSFAGYAFGRNDMDIITANEDGIGHYNGTDLVTIYPKWNIELDRYGSIVFENDFFYIWDDSYNTFIVHGKLK